MNIPDLITQSEIRALATPEETHYVRVILHEVPFPGQFRLRTHRRQYLFERDGIAEVHLLDIPVSVWMHEVPAGQFRDNPSLSNDFRTVANSVKWSFQVIAIKRAVEAIPVIEPAISTPEPVQAEIPPRSAVSIAAGERMKRVNAEMAAKRAASRQQV